MRVPRSTYRLQLHAGFDLDAAASLVGYLARLGVDAVYTSPLLTAAPGSSHGYDVVDPTRVNPELGGEEARLRLVRAVRFADMGLVVDIVPNHMSVAKPSANPWWWDVLEHGRESRYAKYFDIDWSQGLVVLPILAEDGDAPDVALPESSHYRLVSWRRGNSELNYRRFFDITSLAAVRVEDPEVFAATHDLLLSWVAAGEVDGLRVDHPDGLADPGEYLRRLRSSADCWLVVEKILAPGETLPASWPVHGTTGYDALRQVCGVFIDPAGEPPLTALAGSGDFHAVESECRRLVANTALAAEIRRIAALSASLTEEAVAELMVAFPVYRSYLPEGRRYWDEAVQHSGSSTVDSLVLADPAGELATRIQQTSGMVVAKGTEDTAFYRYTRFLALNEVGGAPDRFGVPVAEFHTAAAARESSWPLGMTTLSTHDTKRSEDVRARLAVLSELPQEWVASVQDWTRRRGLPEPSLNLLAWQTLVGAWPIDASRLGAYLDKAAKEAKVRTSWTDHDKEFEAAVAAWPASVLDDQELSGTVAAFVARIERAGWSNSLGQKLIQLAGPGVPDVYQGTELWDLSLVDPDNRRPVDYVLRAELLERLEFGWLPEVDHTGAAKLHVVRTVLRLRRDRPELFSGYRPLFAEGPAADHVLAFARSAELVAVATRLPAGLERAGGWRDTVLPLPAGPGTWTDLLTGRPVSGRVVGEPLLGGLAVGEPLLGELLARYPVALLVRGSR